jgi:hypothetical protein
MVIHPVRLRAVCRLSPLLATTRTHTSISTTELTLSSSLTTTYYTAVKGLRRTYMLMLPWCLVVDCWWWCVSIVCVHACMHACCRPSARPVTRANSHAKYVVAVVDAVVNKPCTTTSSMYISQQSMMCIQYTSRLAALGRTTACAYVLADRIASS